MSLDQLPTLALLASDEGFAGFSLRMQRVEVLLQTFLRGFARVSCAAQRVCGELLILAECTEEVQTCESFAGR